MQVDCTAEVELCREHQITGFPSIRVFRAGELGCQAMPLLLPSLCPHCLALRFACMA